MNKGIKLTLGIVAGLGIFGAGMFGKDTVKTFAGSSWSTNAENAAYGELIDTANSTKNELVSNIDSDVNSKINTAIGSSVDEQQAELARLLEEYYKMKLDGMTESEQFKQLEQRIRDIQQNVLESFKNQIDQEFANQTQGQ